MTNKRKEPDDLRDPDPIWDKVLRAEEGGKVFTWAARSKKAEPDRTEKAQKINPTQVTSMETESSRSENEAKAASFYEDNDSDSEPRELITEAAILLQKSVRQIQKKDSQLKILKAEVAALKRENNELKYANFIGFGKMRDKILWTMDNALSELPDHDKYLQEDLKDF